MPKVAIYTRVSTGSQSDESQINELRSYCQRRGWGSPLEFRDVISGSKFTRKGLDEMMALARRGGITTIIMFKLDRLGRSLAHLAMLIQELNSHGVGLVCTTQGIDTSEGSAVGRLQLGVLMSVAEFEREVIRERVNAGLAAARARGQKLGRPDQLSKRSKEVLQLVKQGLGIRQIARELQMPVSSVHKLCKKLRQ